MSAIEPSPEKGGGSPSENVTLIFSQSSDGLQRLTKFLVPTVGACGLGLLSTGEGPRMVYVPGPNMVPVALTSVLSSLSREIDALLAFFLMCCIIQTHQVLNAGLTSPPPSTPIYLGEAADLETKLLIRVLEQAASTMRQPMRELGALASKLKQQHTRKQGNGSAGKVNGR